MKNIQRYLRRIERERRAAFFASINFDTPEARAALEELAAEAAKLKPGVLSSAPFPSEEGKASQGFAEVAE